MPDSSISPPAVAVVPPDLLAALDAASVQRLRELDPDGAHGLVARVLETFVDSLARHLDELRVARAATDAAALRHVAHTLKSSAASVGALELAHWCTDVERALRERPSEPPDAVALEAMTAQMQRLLALAGRAA